MPNAQTWQRRIPLPSPRTVQPCAVGGFVSFFRNEYLPVVRFIRRAGATPEEAEDAVAAAMVSAYRSWAALNNPGAWPRTSALRLYIRQRERDRARTAVATRATAVEPPTTAVEDPDERKSIIALLRTLPPAQLEVMALAVDGYTPAEIASLLDKTPPTVRSNLRRARRRLEQIVDRSGNQRKPPPTAGRESADRGNGGRHDV
jgi:RNA polymerase sigma factor (sigma-70 family)